MEVINIAETRISVRVDSATKKQAEAVFIALGMNMSTGINIFLTQVARSRAIPFTLVLDRDPLEHRMHEAVNAEIFLIASSGSPIALYDDAQNRPYLEYSDGRRVYDIDITPPQ